MCKSPRETVNSEINTKNINSERSRPNLVARAGQQLPAEGRGSGGSRTAHVRAGVAAPGPGPAGLSTTSSISPDRIFSENVKIFSPRIVQFLILERKTILKHRCQQHRMDFVPESSSLGKSQSWKIDKFRMLKITSLYNYLFCMSVSLWGLD